MEASKCLALSPACRRSVTPSHRAAASVPWHTDRYTLQNGIDLSSRLRWHSFLVQCGGISSLCLLVQVFWGWVISIYRAEKRSYSTCSAYYLAQCHTRGFRQIDFNYCDMLPFPSILQPHTLIRSTFGNSRLIHSRMCFWSILCSPLLRIQLITWLYDIASKRESQ